MKNSISKNILLSLATITALSLTSCGGGGGSSATPTTATDSTTAQKNITGKAVDGYLVKSTVCLDLNMDNYCDIASNEEPVTSTDENGSFALTVTAEQQKHKNFAIAPLLVYGGYDADNGPSVSFTGKLRAVRGEGVINITPTTTTIEKMVREQNLTHTEAQKAVREMMGLPEGIDLGADPVALAKDGNTKLLNANLKLHKSLELMADTLKKAQDTNKKANQVLKSTDELIDDLYSKLALAYQEDRTQNLDKVFEKVIDENNDFTDKVQAKLNTEALGKKINDFIGTDKLDNSEKLGAKINSLQNIIIGGNASIDEDGKVILKGKDGKNIDDTYFDDFVLMHGYEILDIINYSKNDIDLMAEEVSKVLKDAGMEDKYLPVEEEILALKSNPLTKLIGEDFEKVNKFVSGDIKVSKDLIEILAGKTLWISTKYNDVNSLQKIIFTPDMQKIIYVEMVNGIIQEKGIDKLIIDNDLLISINEDGEVDETKILNLDTLKVDGFLLLKDKDEADSIKLYFDKAVALSNPTIEKDIYGDYYNGNSTTTDKSVIDLPKNPNINGDKQNIPSGINSIDKDKQKLPTKTDGIDKDKQNFPTDISKNEEFNKNSDLEDKQDIKKEDNATKEDKQDINNENNATKENNQDSIGDTENKKVKAIRGVLVDPYISGATLYEDANDNGEFDDGEAVSTPTTDKGKFEFAQPLTEGSIVRIKEQGMHEGKKFDLNITAKVDENGQVEVISPLTTFQEKELEKDQVVNIFVDAKSKIEKSTKYLDSFDIKPQDITADPLSGDLMEKPIDKLNDSDLSKIIASFTSYGLFKIINGIDELKTLSGSELESSEEIKEITAGLLDLVTGIVNKDYLQAIAKENTNDRLALGLTVEQMPDIKTGLIIQVGTKYIDVVAQAGYNACNQATGSIKDKINIALLAGGKMADKVGGDVIYKLGSQLYAIKYRDVLRNIPSQILEILKSEEDNSFYQAIVGNQTTFNFNQNGSIEGNDNTKVTSQDDNYNDEDNYNDDDSQQNGDTI